MEIYAELTKKLQYQLDSGDFELRLPPHVAFVRNKRSLHIDCEDEEILYMVEDLLYEGGIPFQRNDND